MVTNKTLWATMACTMLALGAAIALTAIGAYNHGNLSYAIYAVGSATFCGTAAIMFAIMSAASR